MVRTCSGAGCGRPPLKGKRRCYFHFALSLPIEQQVAAAHRRLARTELRRARVPKAQWPDGERWCAGCQSFVPLFYTRGSRCVACASAASHGGAIEKTYGIDRAEYERLMTLQGWRCAICRNKPASRRLAVDHSHKTGQVRGLLCKSCNHDLLGAAHDDVEILRRAVAYLENPPARYVP